MRSFILMDLNGLRCSEVEVVKQMEVNKYLTVTCDNERELMLCEQVIRMCRGEAGDMLNVNNEWVNKSSLHALDIRYEYRAKPKKELVVPWEFIPDDVVSVLVNEAGVVQFFFTNGQWCYPSIKLHLTDIELPVTVKRPEGK